MHFLLSTARKPKVRMGDHGDVLCSLGQVLKELGAEMSHFLLSTARKPKVRLEIMAEMKPIQLKDNSAADAMATPTCTTRFEASR